MNAESEYALQTLILVTRMASSGDYLTPEKMGMSSGQLSEIASLNTQEMHEMAMLVNADFVKISFDSEAIEVALEITRKKTLRTNKIYELLKAGASYPVMKYLYGLTTTDMASYRRFLRLPKGDGRPSLPGEEGQALLWTYMKPGDLKSSELAEKLITASDETGIKVNAIWSIINQWEKENM